MRSQEEKEAIKAIKIISYSISIAIVIFLLSISYAIVF